MIQKLFVIVLCTWLFHVPAWAQESETRYQTPEEGFALMRQQAADQEYSSAKQTGIQLLEENPEYHDVSLYLAILRALWGHGNKTRGTNCPCGEGRG